MPRASPVHRLDATIGSLAPGGDGVAHVEVGGERRAVFVPRTAVGDVVHAEIDPSRRPARGRLLALHKPSPDRVPPACRWSTRCGGCDWMHLSLDAQARTHTDHVRAALPARWRTMPIRSYPAPDKLGSRQRARVHVHCTPGRVLVGMNEANTHDPVQVETCAVLDPGLDAARRMLTTLFEGSRGRGEVHLAFGVGRRPVLDVRWTGDLSRSCFSRLEQAVGALDVAGAQVTVAGATRAAAIGDPTPWMVGADGLPLRLVPGGFAQASEVMNIVLARHLEQHARSFGVEQAVELHAGAGNWSVLLAPAVGHLVLVESHREACNAARLNLGARGLDRSTRVVEADADTYAWGTGVKLVIFDPPRRGAIAVARRLAASRVPHVIYVSCDPQTLGRDLACLETAYDPLSIATFEMFPHTSHVETLVVLERAHSERRASRQPP